MDGNEKIANRRKLYDFAKSDHSEKPAEIEIGKPYDLNPSSYEDTKQIIRNESKRQASRNMVEEIDHGLLLCVIDHHSSFS